MNERAADFAGVLYGAGYPGAAILPPIRAFRMPAGRS